MHCVALFGIYPSGAFGGVFFIINSFWVLLLSNLIVWKSVVSEIQKTNFKKGPLKKSYLSHKVIDFYDENYDFVVIDELEK